ncbi:MAG: hypothetical protein C0433_05905 [Cyclobacterium sp.]|nr:hypothetical protein [Cyclobacterium sp.]
MPCHHRFQNDLQLAYTNWEIRTLFIGTFNPAWLIPNNNAQWFYGRVARNDFWGILPSIHNGELLIDEGPQEWKNFCRNHFIGITDIISSLEDADVGDPDHVEKVRKFRDADLATFEIIPNDIPLILERHKTIEQICLTRNTLPNPWNGLFQPTFDWVAEHPERNIEIKLLRSPSRGARNGVVGNFTQFIAAHWQQVGGYQIK